MGDQAPGSHHPGHVAYAYDPRWVYPLVHDFKQGSNTHLVAPYL